VCDLSRAGVPAPEVKHAEGRWAALREVQRGARGTDDAGTAARALAISWSADLERLRRSDAGPDWIAYRTGGLAALRELLGDDAGRAD
jgi:hypothetical protein